MIFGESEDGDKEIEGYLKHGMATALYEIPEGYQLVPIEPTIKMIEAGKNTFKAYCFHEDMAQSDDIYKAMLNAAKGE